MKLLLALFVVANFGYSQCLSVSEDSARIQHELENIVTKYRYIATDNVEFTQLIDRCYYVSRLPNTDANMLEKLAQIKWFKAYDKERQTYEDQLHRRVNEIDALLADRKLGKYCRKFYRAQKSILEKSYKLTNFEKLKNYTENNIKCYKRQEYDDDYDYI